VAWGENTYTQTNVPPGLADVVAVAAGNYHSLALRSDGTVVAWGDNAKGQTDIPSGLSNVVAIAAGGNQSVALVGSHPPVTRVALNQYLLVNHEFTITLPTEAGRVYRLESADDLDTPVWHPYPLVSGNGGPRELRDTNATTAARFYRVRRW